MSKDKAEELAEAKAMMSTSVAEDYEIIARLTRKLQKARTQNTALRKYARHHSDCMATHLYNDGSKCTCGLDKLLNIKKQTPI